MTPPHRKDAHFLGYTFKKDKTAEESLVDKVLLGKNTYISHDFISWIAFRVVNPIYVCNPLSMFIEHTTAAIDAVEF